MGSIAAMATLWGGDCSSLCLTIGPPPHYPMAIPSSQGEFKRTQRQQQSLQDEIKQVAREIQRNTWQTLM